MTNPRAYLDNLDHDVRPEDVSLDTLVTFTWIAETKEELQKWLTDLPTQGATGITTTPESYGTTVEFTASIRDMVLAGYYEHPVDIVEGYMENEEHYDEIEERVRRLWDEAKNTN